MRLSQTVLIFLFIILFKETNYAWHLPVTIKEEKEYDVQKIPAELLKDADAVVRINIVRFEIISRKKSKAFFKRAVTILKKEGKYHGELSINYNKFIEIDDIEGKLFNASGEEIRELTSEDIKDYGTYGGYASFEDNREKCIEMYHNELPYTIEFTYEISFKGNLIWPKWTSQITLDPIEQNRFEVSFSNEDSLRYWCNNDTVKPTITIDGSEKTYTWETRNLLKLSKDIIDKNIEDATTIVYIAPSLFKIEEYHGDMRTWKSFGIWYFSLIKGRDKLPQFALNDINSLILPSDDAQTKIKKLYRYMQDRTRYVSIKLGIGGWQPLDATFVHEHGYGDCKALSNYMVALLKEANIIAYTVLIKPGSHRYTFIEEFPCNQFSHVIVCVPLEKDTVWLECTSQSIPYAHLGAFTENRGALLITPEGGIVVHTPNSTPQQNLQQRSAHAFLSSSGKAEVQSLEVRDGNHQDYIRRALYNASPQDRERWILNNIDIPNANLKSYKLEGMEDHNLRITLSLELSLPRFASASGDRIFFTPNLMERQTYIPPDVSQRLSPIRYEYPFLDIDTIIYTVPNNYKIESMPSEIHLESSFGSYHSNIRAFGDTLIIYSRSKEIREYSIPTKNYPEYRKFCADIVRADKAQIVLVRKPW